MAGMDCTLREERAGPIDVCQGVFAGQTPHARGSSADSRTSSSTTTTGARFSIEGFMEELDTYMHYYAEEREKESLGWLSPLRYRKSLGIAA